MYLTCLHFPQGLYVHEIVRETGMNRSTVDVVLERLVAAGFANRLRTGSRDRYLAQSPEALLFRQEQALDDFRSVLPMLSRLGTKKGETEIRFFEGRKGLRQAYDDILFRLKYAEGERRQLVNFSGGLDVLKIFPDIQAKFIDKRVQMGVWYRGIVPASSTKKQEYAPYPKDLRLVKTVEDAQFPFRVTLDIYADSALIYSPGKPYGGVVIRNEKIADSLRALFYLVWNMLPEPRNRA